MIVGDKSSLRLSLIATGCVVIQLVVSATLFYAYSPYFAPNSLFLAVLTYFDLCLVFALSCVYFIAYKFYDDGFFLLLSAAWISNAVSVFFQLLPGVILDPDANLIDLTWPFIISILVFHIATFISPNESPKYGRVILQTGLLVIALFTFLFLYPRFFPEFWKGSAGYTRLNIYWLVFVIPISTFVLFRVGNRMRSSVDTKIHGIWATLLPLTFYVYASLQPLMVLKLLPYLSPVAASASLIAINMKFLNGISAINMMRRDSQRLQEKMKERSALEDIGALAANIEHDIRNPLAIIQAEILRMKKEFQTHPKILAGLSKIDQNTERIFAATKIVSILRNDIYLRDAQVEDTNLKGLLLRCWNYVRQETNSDNISFTISGDEVLQVSSNRPLLEEAIVNIIKNAIEAIQNADRGDGVINAEIKLVQDSEEIMVSITDNGCGITKDNLQKLTTLFSTKKEKANSGIGLYITSRIIRLLNGKLEIRSEVGEGATVSILLPARGAEASSYINYEA
jgi:signal transduction histidine kinase